MSPVDGPETVMLFEEVIPVGKLRERERVCLRATSFAQTIAETRNRVCKPGSCRTPILSFAARTRPRMSGIPNVVVPLPLAWSVLPAAISAWANVHRSGKAARGNV